MQRSNGNNGRTIKSILFPYHQTLQDSYPDASLAPMFSASRDHHNTTHIFQRKYLTKQCFDSLWSPWHPVKNGRSLSNDPEGHHGTISSTKGIPIALTRVYAQVGRVVDCKDCKECQEMHERLADLFKRSLTDNCGDSATSNIQQT